MNFAAPIVPEPEFWTGDALACLEMVASGSVDCVICDPPYGETSLKWDKVVDLWPGECRRVLKRTGSMWVFGSFKSLRAQRFDGWTIAQDIVWEKHNGSNALADRFRRVHELALHLYRDDAPWSGVYKQPQFTPDATARTVRRKQRPPQWGAIDESFYESHDGGPRLMRSVIRVRSCHGHALHPTQKPTDLIEPLISYSCAPGGLVLDCFAGVGSVALAAHRLGRRSLNFEINPDYVALAKGRVAALQPR
jgi:site-specific DNA-methyltransferase (adenine-specific)